MMSKLIRGGSICLDLYEGLVFSAIFSFVASMLSLHILLSHITYSQRHFFFAPCGPCRVRGFRYSNSHGMNLPFFVFDEKLYLRSKWGKEKEKGMAQYGNWSIEIGMEGV